MKTARYSIVGLTPLLCHSPLAMFEEATGGKGARKNIPTPEDEAEKGVYRMENGAFGFPGLGIRNSIIEAASAWKMGKTRSSLRGKLTHLRVVDEIVPLLLKTGKPMKSYVIDRRRAKIQGQGIIRSRPRFDDWRIDFDLEYDEQLLDAQHVDLLKPILADAGSRIGIGDYRPGAIVGSRSLPGWFGRFSVA